MDEYLIPAEETTTEIQVSNSRFISSIAPAFSVDQARDFILEINSRYADATHNVPAYIIGSGSSKTSHASDDGEPSGTAGRPALAVLDGSGLGDTVLVITRYFGGTKLGTGGLVKAYSEAAKSAVSAVPKARRIEVDILNIQTPYHLYETIQRLVQNHEGHIEREKFTDQVSLQITIPSTNTPGFQAALQEGSSGTVSADLKKANQAAKIPLAQNNIDL